MGKWFIHGLFVHGLHVQLDINDINQHVVDYWIHTKSWFIRVWWFEPVFGTHWSEKTIDVGEEYSKSPIQCVQDDGNLARYGSWVEAQKPQDLKFFVISHLNVCWFFRWCLGSSRAKHLSLLSYRVEVWKRHDATSTIRGILQVHREWYWARRVEVYSWEWPLVT